MVSPQIHQHPDGTISVRVGDQVYSDTEQNFKKDFGGSFSKLPPGIDERLYEQGVRHALSSKNSVVDGGPMPWVIGDTVLGNLNDALDKKQQRLDKEVKRLKKQADDETEAHQKKIKEDVDKFHADIEEKELKQREARNQKHTEEFEEKKKAGEQKFKKEQAEIEQKVQELEAKREQSRKEQEARDAERLANPNPPLPPGITPDRYVKMNWDKKIEEVPLPDDKSNQG